MSTIRTALVSVYDKSGLVELAQSLVAKGVRILSTGGTAAHLNAAGVEVRRVEDLAGQAEMLGGRVKTLQPAVFGGILARRESAAQMAEIAAADVAPIDLVVVNLYPFEGTVAAPHSLEQALEQIDIGGVALLRAAYKNFPGVAVVVDPADYAKVAESVGEGHLDLAQRASWAQKAVAHTAAYEAAICNYLTALDPETLDLNAEPRRQTFPRTLALTFRSRQTLRYGENPHQPAIAYTSVPTKPGVATGVQLQGKEMSFNNFLDADAAWWLVGRLGKPGAVVIKHANPCGAAQADSLAEAYRRARATDPTSAFGGIVGVNGAVDEETAREIASTFIEVVVAPAYDEVARSILADKTNLRLLEVPASPDPATALDPRWVSGGLLLQRGDGALDESWEVAGEHRPSVEQERDLRFLWSLIPGVKSNAIVVGRNARLLGVGAGQMSRVDSCRIAIMKATEAGHALAGACAASDAFFPFPDGVEVLAQAGVRAIVQPGGSRRDDEVIAAADRADVAIVHTGSRHFRH